MRTAASCTAGAKTGQSAYGPDPAVRCSRSEFQLMALYGRQPSRAHANLHADQVPVFGFAIFPCLPPRLPAMSTSRRNVGHSM